LDGVSRAAWDRIGRKGCRMLSLLIEKPAFETLG
jgi:hypothetical protein